MRRNSVETLPVVSEHDVYSLAADGCDAEAIARLHAMPTETFYRVMMARPEIREAFERGRDDCRHAIVEAAHIFATEKPERETGVRTWLYVSACVVVGAALGIGHLVWAC